MTSPVYKTLPPPPTLLLPKGTDHGDDNHHQEQQQQQQQGQERRRPAGGVGGVAYGGYARKTVGRALDRLPAGGAGRVEDYPCVLSAALREASLLVGGLKRPSSDE